MSHLVCGISHLLHHIQLLLVALILLMTAEILLQILLRLSLSKTLLLLGKRLRARVVCQVGLRKRRYSLVEITYSLRVGGYCRGHFLLQHFTLAVESHLFLKQLIVLIILENLKATALKLLA